MSFARAYILLLFCRHVYHTSKKGAGKVQRSLRFICSFFIGYSDDNLQFCCGFGRKFPANLYPRWEGEQRFKQEFPQKEK